MRLKHSCPRICGTAAVSAFLLTVASPVLAAVYPHAEGAAVMADWVVLAFLVFFGAALIVFLVTVRRGYLSNLEEAKYYLLTIEEPDYYTPDWIRETQGDDERK